MALIDSDNFIAHLIWSGLIDKATCGELKEAIELCTVKDVYTKADMVAMLTDMCLEFEEELNCGAYCDECQKSCEDIPAKWFIDFIQEKINKLKENKDGTADNI